MGQRAEQGLSLQLCWEIPQKDTTTLLNRTQSSNNNRHKGGGVMQADGNGRTMCKNKNMTTAKNNKYIKAEREALTPSKY